MNEAVEPVAISPFLTITTPTLHMLVRSLFAVSKSIAANYPYFFSLHRQRYDKKRYTKFFFPVQFPIFETSAAK